MDDDRLTFAPGLAPHDTPLRVREYDRHDLARVGDAHLLLPELQAEGLDDYALRGSAWTVTQADTPVCCWGLLRPWAGLAEAWCVVSPQLPTRTRAFLARSLRAWLAEALGYYGIRRAQCRVRVGEEPHRRFAEWLGFVEETYLVEYGPTGEDYYLMRMLRDEGGW